MLRRGCGTLQPDGRYYGSGVTETDRSLSAKYFEEAAKSGDPLAIGNLAFFHLDGKVHTRHKSARTQACARARIRRHAPLARSAPDPRVRQSNAHIFAGTRPHLRPGHAHGRSARRSTPNMECSGGAAAPTRYPFAVRPETAARRWAALPALGLCWPAHRSCVAVRVPAQMWASPAADLGGVCPVLVQMWQRSVCGSTSKRTSRAHSSCTLRSVVTSAPGLPSALPPHRDGLSALPTSAHWAHPCHICTGIGLAFATSAPGRLAPALPHLHRG